MSKRACAALMTAILIILIAIMFYVGIPKGEYAFGAGGELTVKQENEVYYCGANYLTGYSGSGNNKIYTFASFDGENDLEAALSYTYLNKTVTPDFVEFVNVSAILSPDEYECRLKVTLGEEIFDTAVKITISKAPLIVRVKINGEDYCEVDEGEEYTVSVVYEGFVGSDDEKQLKAPAIVQKIPKMATTGYQIVAELAQSDYYDFDYRGAIIVINSNPLTEWKSEDEELVLNGRFNRYCNLKYNNIPISDSDPRYVAINEKVERYFGGDRVFEEYEQACAYQINMYLDERYTEFSTPINVKIKLPEELSGKKFYRVMHFFNNGSYEFLNATEVNGYISFSTSDLGDFVLLTPIEGASNVTIVAMCIIGVGVVLLVVIMFAIFRRKY